MKSQIAKRSFLYLIEALLAFALFAWVTYMLLTASMRTDRLEQTMLDYAESVADFVADRLENHGLGATPNYLSDYLGQLERLTDLQMWVVDKDYQITASDPALGSAELAAISANTGDIIARAFAGEVSMGSGSPGIMADQSITVGSPIRAADGSLLGVVLVHAPSIYVDELARSGVGFVLASLIIAFVLVLAIGPTAISAFAKSVDHLVDATQAMASGDFSQRAHVDRKDELVLIADNVNRMAEQLMVLSEESRRHEQVRHDFITDTSKAIVGPIQSIKNRVLALCRQPGGAVSERAASQILGDIQYLERLVDNLFDLTVLQDGVEPLQKEPLDLCELAEHVVGSMRPEGELRGVEIVCNRAGTMPFIGNRERLEQMLGIVVDNAIKYAPQGSKVIVSSIERANSYSWSVVDWGTGISPEETEQIFDRFYRGAAPDSAEGIGLGLPIAREIAEQHCIQIEVDSRPGKTEFVFIFPTDPQVSFFGG